MSSIVPSYSPARSCVDEIQAKLCDLSQDLDKFAPEHRNQVMVDRLRQQKLRAMISLAKAQQFLAETDVLIADYNLQAIADEFEHMKKERYNNNTDTRSPQNSELKEDKLVLSTDCPPPANIGNPKDFSSCTPLAPAVCHSESKEKGTELTPKLSTQHAEAHRSKKEKSKPDASYTTTPKDKQQNKIGGSEPTTINEPTSKVTKVSSKTHEPTTLKTYKDSSSKTKEAASSKTYEASSSKTKEGTTSKTHESRTSTKEAASLANTDLPAPGLKSKKRKRSKSKSKERKRSESSKPHESRTSTKEAASLANTDLPAPGLKSKKRKRSKSKSKERKRSESKSKDRKRHKSSHKHPTSSHAPTAVSNTPAEATHAPAASTHAPAASTHAPAASSNVQRATLGPVASSHVSAASSNVHTAFSRAPPASSYAPAASLVPAASSQVHALLSHAPNCDCLKSNRTYKEKTLLNTSISPIKRIVEAKAVQTDEKTSKKAIVQTNAVETLTKGVQTDNVIILHVGSHTARENSPVIDDEETLLLDTLPAPHSHSTAISLAKALQQIKTQKTSVLERLCPTGPDESFLSQNEVLQKIELIVDEEAETVEERPGVVKMEVPDADLPNTSTELLVNNLYKDIMKAKDRETSEGMKPKGKVTKRGIWKVLDKC